MMRKRAMEVAHSLISVASELKHLPFYIVSHADADGITAATIITRILTTHKIHPTVVFTNSHEINEIVYHGTIKQVMKSQADAKEGIWIFTDTGYKSHHTIEKIRKKIIIDHHYSNQHKPRINQMEVPQSITQDSWTVLFSPHIFGIVPNECTTSFLTYLIAKNVPEHRETGTLAVIGALGDGIYSREFTLTGLVREAVSDAALTDEITIKRDLVVPGKETLSLANLLIEMNNMLEMGFDAEAMLREICVDLKFKPGDLEKVKWIELSLKEKRSILSWIAKKKIEKGRRSRGSSCDGG